MPPAKPSRGVVVGLRLLEGQTRTRTTIMASSGSTVCLDHRDRRATMNGPQGANIIQCLSPYVAWASQADLTVARDRRWSKADGDCIAVRPKRDLAGLDDIAGAGLENNAQGCPEIDLLAPCLRLGIDRQCVPDPIGRGGIEQARADRHVASADENFPQDFLPLLVALPAASDPLRRRQAIASLTGPGRLSATGKSFHPAAPAASLQRRPACQRRY